MDIKLKDLDHQLIYEASNGKQFTNKQEYIDYCGSDLYLEWHSNRIKELEFKRDNKDDLFDLQNYYNQNFKHFFECDFSDLPLEAKKEIKNTVGFNSYKVGLSIEMFKIITSKYINKFFVVLDNFFKKNKPNL